MIAQQTQAEIDAAAQRKQAIYDFVVANIDNPAAISAAAAQFGVSSTELAQAVGVPVAQVASYFASNSVAAPEAVVAATPVGALTQAAAPVVTASSSTGALPVATTATAATAGALPVVAAPTYHYETSNNDAGTTELVQDTPAQAAEAAAHARQVSTWQAADDAARAKAAVIASKADTSARTTVQGELAPQFSGGYQPGYMTGGGDGQYVPESYTPLKLEGFLAPVLNREKTGISDNWFGHYDALGNWQGTKEQPKGIGPLEAILMMAAMVVGGPIVGEMIEAMGAAGAATALGEAGVVDAAVVSGVIEGGTAAAQSVVSQILNNGIANSIGQYLLPAGTDQLITKALGNVVLNLAQGKSLQDSILGAGMSALPGVATKALGTILGPDSLISAKDLVSAATAIANRDPLAIAGVALNVADTRLGSITGDQVLAVSKIATGVANNNLSSILSGAATLAGSSDLNIAARAAAVIAAVESGDLVRIASSTDALAKAVNPPTKATTSATGGTGVSTLTGGVGADTITTAANDVLSSVVGGTGADSLTGDTGDDDSGWIDSSITGAEGDDSITTAATNVLNSVSIYGASSVSGAEGDDTITSRSVKGSGSTATTTTAALAPVFINGVPTCGDGYTYNASIKACVQDDVIKSSTVSTGSTNTNNCGAGYTWNGTACVETTLAPVVVSGIPICGEGYTYDASVKTCVADAVVRSTDTANFCPAGYTWNGTACVEATLAAVVISGIPVCGEGYTYDASVNACIADAVVISTDTANFCPSGYHWDVATSACVENTLETVTVVGTPDCGLGYHWDAAAKSCVLDTVVTTDDHGCKTGYTWSETAKACVETTLEPVVITPDKTCPIGQHWDETTKGCVADTVTHTCPTGQHWDETTKACVLDTVTHTCPTGQHWDEATKACVADTHTCPVGQHWDETTKACVVNAAVTVVTPPVLPPTLSTSTPAPSAAAVDSGQTQKPFTQSTGLSTGEASMYESVYDPSAIAAKGITSPMSASAGKAEPLLMNVFAPSGQAAPSYYNYGSEPQDLTSLFSTGAGGSPLAMASGGSVFGLPSPLMAAGGVTHKGSHYVQGDGGGQDDLIDAKLADGEYVFDADIVAALGDGSNKQGALKLDKMRQSIREHKRSAPNGKIPPKAKSPLAYLKG